MSALRLFRLAGALLLVAGIVPAAHAQQDCECSPFYGCENDLQWFDPVEFELDCTLGEPCGFFFSYERTYWNATGHRTTIGDPNITQQTFNPWPIAGGGLQGDGVIFPFQNAALAPPLQAIQPVTLVNSLQNSAPRSEFALGHRYEFGYYKDQRGWLIGVLDAGDHTTSIDFANEDTLNFPADTELQNPYGGIVVNFVTPPGYMAGFVDTIDNDLFDNPVGGRVFPVDLNGDGIPDGDGFADDLNGNGIYGPDGIDTDGDGVPDTVNLGPGPGTGNIPDYEDMVLLPTSFQTLQAVNRTETRGIELMRRYRLDNSHFMKKKQHNVFEVFYGARYISLKDDFLVTGDGGVMGLSQWDTRIHNNIIGPQIGYKWDHHRGRWTLASTGRALFGYNIQNWRQDGFVGGNFVAGALNRPLYAHPHAFNYGQNESDFSPVGELRFEAAYHVTSNIQLKATYTATFIGGISRASDSVRYELPNMGFVEGDTDSIFLNGIGFGVEINQ